MTTLTATPQAGTALLPPRVLLQVTGAPVQPTNAYASNFATVDGWSGASAAIVLGNLRLSGSAGQPAGTTSTGSKTLTGLTVGAQYKYRANLVTQTMTQARLRLTGGVSGAYVITLAAGAWLELVFTATATSHVIAIDLQNTSAGATPIVDVSAVTVQPSGTWQGTTIRRTDANGISVVVREDAGGLDTVAGSLTLYDLEAALTGPIRYVVTDGAGATASALTSFTTQRINRVSNPDFELGLTGWQSTNANAVLTTTTAAPIAGARSGLLTCVTAGTIAAQYAPTLTDRPAVTPGETIQISALVRSSAALTMSVDLSWYDAAGGAVGGYSAGAPTAVPAATPTTLSRTAVVPALAVYARVLIVVAAAAVGNTVTIDETYVGSLGDYFDGDTPNTATTQNAWTSTPHASPSAQTVVGTGPQTAWLTIPASAVPSAGTITARPLELVIDYAEDSTSNGSLHTIIGRADPIANPGPLALRAGTIQAFCSNYTNAKRIRDLLAAGDVAQMRQPANPGMDMYLTAQRVAISPAGTDTAPQRWVATITYAEVLAA